MADPEERIDAYATGDAEPTTGPRPPLKVCPECGTGYTGPAFERDECIFDDCDGQLELKRPGADTSEW